MGGRALLVFLFVCAATAGLGADEPAIDGRKQARASRLPPGAIRLDGRLDDEAWLKAAPITEFVQAEPNEGAAPSDQMEVRFLYDDNALWVGARMRSAPGVIIQAPMSRRDDGSQAEYIQVELDTYLDRRTAYMFGVTASGVRLDHYHPSDNEDDSDAQFDPVWEARTSVDANGWTAELWMPFSQLRFNDLPERIWGLNIKRWRPQLNEEDYWVIVPRTERGWASRFGELRGIDGVRPATRLEVLPYVAASSRMSGNRDRNNPFDDGVHHGRARRYRPEDRARIEPDARGHHQPRLRADRSRPGRSEPDGVRDDLRGAAAVLHRGQQRARGRHVELLLFAPHRRAAHRRGDRRLRRLSATNTILGAAKLTGRTESGTSLGVLGAVTGGELADTFTAGVTSSVQVAPRTAWGVGRVIQEFGRDSTRRRPSHPRAPGHVGA